jgi:hypothetical protein
LSAVLNFLLLILLCRVNIVTLAATAMLFSAAGPRVGRAGAGRREERPSATSAATCYTSCFTSCILPPTVVWLALMSGWSCFLRASSRFYIASFQDLV